MYTVSKGTPQLGCQFREKDANFGIYSDEAPAMVLEVYEQLESICPVVKVILKREECIVDHVFHVAVENIKEGMFYVWRILREDGSYSPSILDPYAYGADYKHKEWRNTVIKQQALEGPKPNIPWENTIIYELHVGHFTADESAHVAENERGTFTGLKHKLPYLKALGVTTLELLPVHMCNRRIVQNRNPETGQLLEDVWGYNTIGFFALDKQYTVSKDTIEGIKEFKQLVKAAHDLGMEILLDVVYNHTGEGGMDRPAINFRHLANHTYYKMNEQGEYLNCAGTGNTFNTNQPVVKELILDSLKYWSVQMGVDGFRFDLASILGQDESGRWIKDSLLNEIANDPVLSKVKLITESWDAKGSYDVGRMPEPFREWSDYFRDTMRKFVKGDQGIIKSVADCTLGKEIYFRDEHKNEKHAIHFITAHDGFTMWDLLSYNGKHNLKNGEDNRDGNNANYSYNWGVEGDTNNPQIISIRKRGMKNFMALLLLSKGIPMLLMGDEMARSQKGNNNAFCQNNDLVWVDWNQVDAYQEILDFTKKVIGLRKSLDYFTAKKTENYQVTWHGEHYNQPDWSYYSRSLAWYIEGPESLYIIANNYQEPLNFELPPIGEDEEWLRLLDTQAADEETKEEVPVKDGVYVTQPYSFVLLKQVKSHKA